MTRKQSNALYVEVLEDNDRESIRELCRNDLFFLLTIACKRPDINNDWLYDRCREVEANPNGHLDLWARDHYKSTIITFGKSIQDILTNPNVTIGIFSHVRPIAKAFLLQIKREFEQNEFLKEYFDDILYVNPEKESPTWSLDTGIIVKRPTNPKECTVEAWGLVEGQPTGKHFKLKVYDDVVTRESVTTSDQIKKTTAAWELSLNLGSKGGHDRYIGTRYHANDTYKTMMQRGSVILRVKPATIDGKADGDPVFLDKKSLTNKRRDMGIYTFACQMLQNPLADDTMGFKKEWLNYYKNIKDTEGWNKYLLCDPAGSKKKTNDYTVMVVIGLAPDNNYYLIDGIRDRLNLTERTEKLFYFHRKYRPNGTGYEKYGMQSDIEHIEEKQEEINYRFSINELGGSLAKNDRILKLVPIFEHDRFWLPEEMWFTDYQDNRVNFTDAFVNDEYLCFPVPVHDDMLDCISRIVDPKLGAEFPELWDDDEGENEPEYTYSSDHGSWMR